MSGNTIVAGGFVVARTERAWVQQAIVPVNFSQGVAIDDDTLVVLPDIYTRNGSTWTLEQEIAWTGLPALSSNTLAIGEWNIGQGEVVIGQRTGTNWSPTAVLTANGNTAGLGLGVSVAVDGDTVVAGAPLEYGAPTNALAAAYVFVGKGTSWLQQARLQPTDFEVGFQLGLDFGVVVAISGDTIAIGDPRDGTNGSYAGAVYMFGRSGTNWLVQQKLTALDGSVTSAIPLLWPGIGWSLGRPSVRWATRERIEVRRTSMSETAQIGFKLKSLFPAIRALKTALASP